MSDSQKKEVDPAAVLAEKSLIIDLEDFFRFLGWKMADKEKEQGHIITWDIDYLVDLANQYQKIRKYGHFELMPESTVVFKPRTNDNQEPGL